MFGAPTGAAGISACKVPSPAGRGVGGEGSTPLVPPLRPPTGREQKAFALNGARLSRKEISIANLSLSGEAFPALYFAGEQKLMKRDKISELTTNRLSVYLRCLNELASAGIKTVSSQELAEQFNLNSAQIRKDLGYFGEFGVRGIGYFIDDLQRHLTNILVLDR